MAYRVYVKSRLRPGVTPAATLEVATSIAGLAVSQGALSMRGFAIDAGGPDTGLQVAELEFSSMVHWAEWRASVFPSAEFQQLQSTIMEFVEPGTYSISGASEVWAG
jgi:hypothetical protein